LLSKALYLTGIAIRNYNIFKNLRFLQESQYWDIKKLENFQLRKLRELLLHAKANSFYYNKKYEKANFNIENIFSIEDIGQIPFITKNELISNAESIHVKNFPEKLFFSETSGSTGKPLVFYRNKDWDAWHRASIFRGYEWHGVKPWERNGYLWGYNYSLKRRIKTLLFDLLQNRFRLFTYKDAEIDRFIFKLKKACYLSGYSSMIYEVAKRVNKTPAMNAHLNLKMVKATSEKIFEKYQTDVRGAFGKKMISEYGAAEAGIIAFECPKGSMHINMETVIVEEIDNEIVVTNLVLKSFPIIRYKMGDYIKIEKKMKCSCGRQHHIIKEVLGRVGKVIYGIRHKYPSLTLYYVFKNLALDHSIILNYKATQHNKGTLYLEIESSLGATERNLLERECIKYFGEDLRIEVACEIDISSRSNKKVDFISEIDDNPV